MKYRSRKGSLTIEAAAVLPLFITGLLTLVSVLFINNVCQRIQASLLNTARELAIVCADGHCEALSSVREDFIRNLPREDMIFIKNGRDGIDMSGSFLDDPEYIELSVSCELVPLTDMFGILSVHFDRKCLAHVWVGYENGFFPDEEYVYITDDGEVYHMDRNCRHLRLTVKEVSPDTIDSCRNNSGSRYKACEICHGSLSSAVLYITPEGDRYHGSIACSGLKRSVRAVKKSMTGGRRPCKTCGR